MLSQKFKSCIYKLFNDMEKGRLYDKLLQKNNYEMGNSYHCIFAELRSLCCNGKLDSDESNYNNHIHNGILSCSNVNEIGQTQLSQLEYLDYMKPKSQDIINQCLDAMDINYVLDEKMHCRIKEIITPHVWEFTLLNIHFKTLMRKIYFVWQMDRTMYMPDIMRYIECVKRIRPNNNLVPIDPYIYFTFVLGYMCEPGVKYDDIYDLFQFVKLLFKKYEHVDVFKEVLIKQVSKEASKNISVKKIEKPDQQFIKQASKDILVKKIGITDRQVVEHKPVISRNELDDLKVQGLKDRCVRLKLNTTYCKVRKDYIDLLLPFVE